MKRKIIGVVLGLLLVFVAFPTVSAQSFNDGAFKFARTLGLIDAFYVDTVNMSNLTEKAIIEVLRSLDPHSSYISAKDVKEMMPFFIINNWIESYQTINGIRHVLKTLSKRTTLPSETRFAIRALKKNYYPLQEDFMEFFPQLIEYVEKDFGIEISHRITIPF